MLSGFYNAPVTKALVVVVSLLTLLAESNKVADAWALSATSLFRRGQVWRLVTAQVHFSTIAEAIFGGILLYKFRVLERMMGPGKFLLFLLLTVGWAAATRTAVLAIPGVESVAPGPYELMFALTTLFHRHIPALHPDFFTICGLRFSDKALAYAMALQLMWNQGARSLLPAVSGVAWAAVYQANVAWVQSWRLPAGMRATLGRTIMSWWDSESPAVAEARAEAMRRRVEERERAAEQAELAAAMAQIHAMQGGGGGGARNRGRPAQPAHANSAGGAPGRRVDGSTLAAALQAVSGGGGGVPTMATTTTGVSAGSPRSGSLRARGGGSSGDVASWAAAVTPDPAAVARLMAMGFTQVEVERALREAMNDETAAANRLVEG